MIRTQVAEHQDTSGTNPSIKWQTMAYEIREYIQQLASAMATKNATDTAANVQTANKLTTIEAEIKRNSPPPSPTWPTKNNGESINPNRGESGGSERKTSKKPRNMKAYCSSHGFHPFGLNHDSATCSWKEPEHTDSRAVTCTGAQRQRALHKWNNRLAPCGKERRPPTQLTSTGDCKHENQQRRGTA